MMVRHPATSQTPNVHTRLAFRLLGGLHWGPHTTSLPDPDLCRESVERFCSYEGVSRTDLRILAIAQRT